MTEWSLAVDFGTTFTSAAMVSGDSVVLLELDGSTKIPSAVALDDDGDLVVGLASGDETGWSPDRVERNPKRSLGRTRHLVLAGRPVPVGDAVGALLRALADEGMRRHNGTPPARLVLTHPVRWGAGRCAELAAAATAVGLPDPELIAEPVAAALHYLDERVTTGELVAVYDLGGGTFDTAVLRRTDGDAALGFELAGEPGGNADLGGERLDDLLFGMITARLSQSHPDVVEAMLDGSTPSGRRSAAELRRDVRRAKEALSRQQAFTVHVGGGADVDVRLTRPEFEALVTAPLRDTVDELAATIERCGVGTGEIAAIYLVGGASRTPLVSRLVSERFGDLPATFDDPKSVVVLGAARLVRTRSSTDIRAGSATPPPVYGPAPEPVPVPVPSQASADEVSDVPRGRRRLLVPLAAAVLAAATLGGAAVLVPRLVSAQTAVPAAVVAPPAPAAAPVPAPVVVAPTTTPPPTTKQATRKPTRTAPKATTTKARPKPEQAAEPEPVAPKRTQPAAPKSEKKRTEPKNDLNSTPYGPGSGYNCDTPFGCVPYSGGGY